MNDEAKQIADRKECESLGRGKADDIRDQNRIDKNRDEYYEDLEEDEEGVLVSS